MRSFGERLRSRRLERGLTIQSVAQDTLISKSHLEALEQEDFSSFPSEAYIIGFLRIYSTYLGLDVEGMIIHYRRTILQNQPAPIAELLHRPKRYWHVWVILGVVCVAALVGGIIQFDLIDILREEAIPLSAEPQDTLPERTYQSILTDTEFVEREFSAGEGFEIPFGTDRYTMVIETLSDTHVHIATSDHLFPIENATQQRIDLNADGSDDLTISVRAIQDQHAVMRISRAIDKPEVAVTPPPNPPLSNTQVSDAEFESVTVILRFSDTSYFRVRYQDTILEEFAREAAVYEWQITSPLHLWISNAAVADLVIGESTSNFAPANATVVGMVASSDRDSQVRWFSLE